MKSVQPNPTGAPTFSAAPPEVRQDRLRSGEDEEALRLACALLQDDQVVAFPTETVYGLGGSALSAQAIATIYRVKGRPAYNPLIVHVPDAPSARALCRDGAAFDDRAAALAARFWPGPLTLVLPRSPRVPAVVSAGLATIALRAPAHPVALRLLRACGLPLAAPSANPSERLSPTSAAHVLRGLPDLPLVLDGGPCALGIESTVVDLTTPTPRLLRPGALSLARLRQALPELQVLQVAQQLASAAPSPSPGMLARHYAPRARVLLVPSQRALETLDPSALAAPIGLLACAPCPALGAAVSEILPSDPPGYAADLFAALHRLDDVGVATIVAVLPPDHEDFAAARDRLRRAATP